MTTKTKTFQNENLCDVSYDDVIAACQGEHFTMTIKNQDEADALAAAVNQGIDAHLEACSCPDRGDVYHNTGSALECEVSPESMPTLLRRLFDGEHEEGMSLASGMLMVLGFNEYGEFVGRDD